MPVARKVRMEQHIRERSITLLMFKKVKAPGQLRGARPVTFGRKRAGSDGATGAAAEGDPESDVKQGGEGGGKAQFVGVGCSAGVAEGPARIVSDLSQAGLVKKGDVLFTLYTNPSWTPLFSLVSAVVLEQGGMLSHAAVVSRECGVPCVVQAPNITQLVRNGQRVRVDGATGTITVL